jgi:phage-related protein
MATFDWAESPGTSVDETPRISETAFGDGYAQRAPDGLNANPQTWKMRFARCENAKANQIIAFFRAQGGHTAFDWTPLWATAPIKVICPTWSRSQPDEWELSDITATFKQVFEP